MPHGKHQRVFNLDMIICLSPNLTVDLISPQGKHYNLKTVSDGSEGHLSTEKSKVLAGVPSSNKAKGQ